VNYIPIYENAIKQRESEKLLSANTNVIANTNVNPNPMSDANANALSDTNTSANKTVKKRQIKPFMGMLTSPTSRKQTKKRKISSRSKTPGSRSRSRSMSMSMSMSNIQTPKSRQTKKLRQ
jgi:hypothetical protein